MEIDVAAIHAEMSQGEYFRQSGERIAEETARLKQLESQLANAYQRWEELEQLAE